MGGGWFSEGTAVCLRGCVTELVSLSATRFINNSATEGAAIYLLSAARHVLSDVEWIGNYGLSSENYIHSDAIVSRGAAVYCGLLGMNISIDGATMLYNVAEEASAISIRSSIFTASLTISNSHIEDSVSETMLKFRHIPQWSITILNSTILGVVFFSNGASVVAVLRIEPTFLHLQLKMAEGCSWRVLKWKGWHCKMPLHVWDPRRLLQAPGPR